MRFIEKNRCWRDETSLSAGSHDVNAHIGVFLSGQNQRAQEALHLKQEDGLTLLFSRFDALARSHGTILRLLAHDLLFSLSPSPSRQTTPLTRRYFDKIGGLSKGHMALEHVDVDEPKIV